MELIFPLRSKKLFLLFKEPGEGPWASNTYDNASCESFLKTLKREEIYANDYRDPEHLRTNIEVFVEQHHNRYRLHSALGYRPPEEFEQTVVSTNTIGEATMRVFRHDEIYR